MRKVLLYLLFLLSGAAGLIYELVWVRQLIFVFGGTTYAITTVLVAFMGGLGLGSFLSGRWAHRWTQPGRVYGIIEICIGLYALLVPALLGVAEPVYRALYPTLANTPLALNLLRFAIGAVILMVPTTLMGATLPILVRYITGSGGTLGRSVGVLYGINTLGAVLGVLSCGFVLLPLLGLLHTTWLAAAFNVTIGVLAMVFLQQRVTGAAVHGPSKRAAAITAAFELTPLARRTLLVGFALSGFAAMVYQVTWSRALVMSTGSTTYSFTCILSAFILGLAVGSLAIARWVDRWRDPLYAFGVLEILIGLVAVLIIPIHGQIPLWVQTIVARHINDYGALMGWQFFIIIAVTFVPTFLMGAIFPLVTRALAASGDDASAATGRAYAVNTIGTITGSFLAGFVLIRSDVLGVQNSIVFASVLNGIIGLVLVLVARRTARLGAAERAPAAAPRGAAWRVAIPVLLLLAIPVVALAAGKWDRRVLTAAPFLNRGLERSLQREIVYYEEGVDLTVTVEHPEGHPEGMTLTVNGKPDASTNPGDMITMLLLGHLPALLHPQPQTACMVGLGSGLSLAALGRHPGFTQLDCVEISEEVIRAAAKFAPYTYNVLTDDPRVRMILADGRNHLLLTDQQYDLVITQPSNPWMSGVSNLFTREYFELAERRLAEHGLVAVWLQGYKTSVPNFKMVVRTLFDVFDHVTLWELAEQDYLMLASREPQALDLADFERRFRDPLVLADLYRCSVKRPAHVLARYVAQNDALRAWVRDAALHTDDNAILEFSAPRQMYTGSREVAEQLYALQHSVFADLLPDGQPSDPLRAEVGRALAARLARVEADRLSHRGDLAGALRLLLERFYASPADVQLREYLVQSRINILRAAPQSEQDPQLVPLLARVRVLPQPYGAPLRGMPLPDLAASFRGAAQHLMGQNQLFLATNLLTDAADIEPGNLDGELLLADVLARQNRFTEAEASVTRLLQAHPATARVHYVAATVAARQGAADSALERLKLALQDGSVPRTTAAADDAFAALRADPRFGALIASPASQPGR